MMRGATSAALLALLLGACQGLETYPAAGTPDADDGPPKRSQFTLSGSFCATSNNSGPRTGLDLLVSNRNTRLLGAEAVADSDADGLSDQESTPHRPGQR